jgi:hypothetical protein
MTILPEVLDASRITMPPPWKNFGNHDDCTLGASTAVTGGTTKNLGFSATNPSPILPWSGCSEEVGPHAHLL